MVSFDTPWKHQKTSSFWIFSGVSKETSGMKMVKESFPVEINLLG